MRDYQRKIGCGVKYSPVELGLIIFTHEMGYDVAEMRRRWFRDRSENALEHQLRALKLVEITKPNSARRWEQDKQDYMVMLWLVGKTSSYISRRMSISRNSVIGKLKRLHLIPQEYINEHSPHVQSAQEAYPDTVFKRGC